MGAYVSCHSSVVTPSTLSASSFLRLVCAVESNVAVASRLLLKGSHLKPSHRVPHTDEKPHDGALEPGADHELISRRHQSSACSCKGWIVAVMEFTRGSLAHFKQSFDHSDEFWSLCLVL